MPNFAFYGVRKQAPTKFYFNFWTWLLCLRISIHEGSPIFDKVSFLGIIAEERKFTFLTTCSLPYARRWISKSLLSGDCENKTKESKSRLRVKWITPFYVWLFYSARFKAKYNMQYNEIAYSPSNFQALDQAPQWAPFPLPQVTARLASLADIFAI